MTYNAGGEVVSGMVIMRKGANAQDVIARIKARVAVLVRTLPPGVQLVPFYDQTELVGRTTHTIQKNLLLGGALVVLLLWAFLRNIAASLIVAVVIPFSMLWAFIMMRWFGFSANLMSLGALDFGLLVDGSVVIVENIMRRSGDPGGPGERAGRRPSRWAARWYSASPSSSPSTCRSSRSRAPSGRCSSHGVHRGGGHPGNPPDRADTGSCTGPDVPAACEGTAFARSSASARLPGLPRAHPRHPSLIIGTLGVLFLGAIIGGTRLGREFMPRLDEGSVLVQSRRLPSTALARDGLFRGDRAGTLTLPEVKSAVSKLGRPDLATEAMGTYESDTYVGLRDRNEWRPGGKEPAPRHGQRSQRHPRAELRLHPADPMRLDEAETGITTDVGVKVIGSDPDTLAMLAGRVERVLTGVSGAAEVRATAASRIKQVRISWIARRWRLRRGQRYSWRRGGAGAGRSIATAVVDGLRRIGVAVRMPDATSIDPALFRLLPIPVAGGEWFPRHPGKGRAAESPEAYAHEGGQRLAWWAPTSAVAMWWDSWMTPAPSLAARCRCPPATVWSGAASTRTSARRSSASRSLVPLRHPRDLPAPLRCLPAGTPGGLVLANVPFALVGGVAALWMPGST